MDIIVVIIARKGSGRVGRYQMVNENAIEGTMLMKRFVSIKKILTETLEEISRDCEMDVVKAKVLEALRK